MAGAGIRALAGEKPMGNKALSAFVTARGEQAEMLAKAPHPSMIAGLREHLAKHFPEASAAAATKLVAAPQMVKIATRKGDPERHVQVLARGGDIVAHKAIGSDDEYSLTHAPTGAGFGLYFKSKAAAAEAIDRFNSPDIRHHLDAGFTGDKKAGKKAYEIHKSGVSVAPPTARAQVFAGGHDRKQVAADRAVVKAKEHVESEARAVDHVRANSITSPHLPPKVAEWDRASHTFGSKRTPAEIMAAEVAPKAGMSKVEHRKSLQKIIAEDRAKGPQSFDGKNKEAEFAHARAGAAVHALARPEAKDIVLAQRLHARVVAARADVARAHPDDKPAMEARKKAAWSRYYDATQKMPQSTQETVGYLIHGKAHPGMAPQKDYERNAQNKYRAQYPAPAVPRSVTAPRAPNRAPESAMGSVQRDARGKVVLAGPSKLDIRVGSGTNASTKTVDSLASSSGMHVHKDLNGKGFSVTHAPSGNTLTTGLSKANALGMLKGVSTGKTLNWALNGHGPRATMAHRAANRYARMVNTKDAADRAAASVKRTASKISGASATAA